MRTFAYGEEFSEVTAEDFPPDPEGIWGVKEDAEDNGGETFPIFSEANLYPRMSKDDARFVLSVAEEYESLIRLFGSDVVKRLLDGESFIFEFTK